MKIGCFVTARLKSSRLTKKIILPLNGGTVLDHVIRRCLAVNGIDDVVLCTSTFPQDAPLYNYALKHKIKFYPGSEDDVLKRLLDAAKYYGFDAFISITADNPLHSIEVSNAIINWLKEEPLDFIFASGLPIGLTPYFINTKALEIAVQMKKESNTEIWGPFVNRPDFFNVGYLHFENDLFPQETRLTCDYVEDYNVIQDIYNHFKKDHNPSIYEVSDLIKQNKVKLTNTELIQASVPIEVMSQIQSTFDNSQEIGRRVAQKIGHRLVPGENKRTIKL